MEIKGTETEKNLQKAFDFVAKRRTQYDIYALVAERHGETELARLLTIFADMEKEHAKLWYKWLNESKAPELIKCFENVLIQEKEEIVLDHSFQSDDRRNHEAAVNHDRLEYFLQSLYIAEEGPLSVDQQQCKNQHINDGKDLADNIEHLRKPLFPT